MKVTVAVPTACPECGGRLGCSADGCAPTPGGQVVARARAAYAAYGVATGGRNHAGGPMPAWDDLGDVIQHAWVCAAIVAASVAGAPQLAAVQRRALYDLQRAQGRLLHRWAEADDDATRNELWSAMHAAADVAWESLAAELGL